MKIVFFMSLFLLVFLISNAQYVIAEEEEEELEDIILSKFSSNVQQIQTMTSEEWEDAFENEFDSALDHEIEVKSLNDGENLFFLISWKDDTKSMEEKTDGMMALLEVTKIEKPTRVEEYEEEDEEDEVEEKEVMTPGIPKTEITEDEFLWKWESDGKTSGDIFVNAFYEDDKWSILLEKKSIASTLGDIEENEIIDAVIKIAVWDGDKNQSFTSIEEYDIPGLKLQVLPEINSQPKDIYVWSSILAIGTGVFIITEIRKHEKGAM